jgi:hypothetical protein
MKIESKLIFISSPYTHGDREVVIENFLKVTRLAAKLCSEGHVAVSPITYGHTLLDYVEMPSDWEFWKNFCLTLLNKCDELIVYKMDGWDKSRGVEEEIMMAESKGIKITYLEYENE